MPAPNTATTTAAPDAAAMSSPSASPVRLERRMPPQPRDDDAESNHQEDSDEEEENVDMPRTPSPPRVARALFPASASAQPSTPAVTSPPASASPMHILDELHLACLDEFQRAVKAHLDAVWAGDLSVDDLLKWMPSADEVELTSTGAALRKSQLALRTLMHQVLAPTAGHAVNKPASSPSKSSPMRASASATPPSYGWISVLSCFIETRKRDISMYGHKEASPHSNARDVVYLHSFTDLVAYARVHLPNMDLTVPNVQASYLEQTALYFLLHPAKDVKASFDREHSKLHKLMNSVIPMRSDDEVVDELLLDAWSTLFAFLCQQSGRILPILKRTLPQIVAIKDVMETLAIAERTLLTTADVATGAASVPIPKVLSKAEPTHSSLVLIRLMRSISLLPLSIMSGFDVTNSYTVLFTLMTLFRCGKMSGKNDMKRFICLTIHRLFHAIASQDHFGATYGAHPVDYKSWFTLTTACYSTLLQWISTPAATKKAKNWSVCALALIDVLCLASPEFFIKEMSNVMENILYRVYNCVETQDSVETYPSLDAGTSSSTALTASPTHPSNGNLHSIVFLSLSRFLSVYLSKVSLRSESVSTHLDRVTELFIHRNKELLWARNGGIDLEAWLAMTNGTPLANTDGAHFVDQALIQEISSSSASSLVQGTTFTKPRNHIFERTTQSSLQVLILTMALANHVTVDSAAGNKENHTALQEDEAEQPERNRTQKRLSMAPTINFTSQTTALSSKAQPLNSGYLFVLHEVILPLFEKQLRNWTTQTQRRGMECHTPTAAAIQLATPQSSPSKPQSSPSKPSLDRTGSTVDIAKQVDSATKFGTEKRGVSVPILVALQSLAAMFGTQIEVVESPAEVGMPASIASISSLVHQLSTQFPILSPRGAIRCHAQLSHTFFVPFSSILRGLLIECFKWVGGATRMEPLVTDALLEDVEAVRRVHNSRACLHTCLSMMTTIWPSYTSAATAGGESPWSSYEMSEASLLAMLIQYTAHQDESIRVVSRDLLRTCMQQPQDGSGSFQPFYILSTALTASFASPTVSSFKPIPRARILHGLCTFLRTQSRWFSMPFTSGGVIPEEELFLEGSAKASVQAGSKQTLEDTLDLLTEFIQIWCKELEQSPLRAPATDLDVYEIEATLVTCLASDHSSVRWNVVKALSALRMLNNMLPMATPAAQKTPRVSEIKSECKDDDSDADESEDEAIEPDAPRIAFITMMESCGCLTSAVDEGAWTGEHVLPNASCSALCFTKPAPLNNDAPTHLVAACRLKGEQWTTYLAHLLRNFKDADLSRRVLALSEELLFDLATRIAFVRQTQAYWKRKYAWSISAALSARRPSEVVPETALTEEELSVWRNLLTTSAVCFASLPSVPTAQEFIKGRLLSLLGNVHPAVRRASCIAMGNWNAAGWIGGPLVAALSMLQNQMREGSVTLHTLASATESSEFIELSPAQVDILRVHLSHVFKLLTQHLDSTSLSVSMLNDGEATTNSTTSNRHLFIRSALVSYLMSSHNFLVKGHSHNEYRWDFIEWRANIARIIARVSILTENTGSDAHPTRTPLLSDPQRKMMFEMFLSWCGYGPSSAVYMEKLKLHTSELMSRISDKAASSNVSEEDVREEQAALQQQLNASIEQLQLLSLNAMSMLLRGKCFDPNLQSQLQSSVSTGSDSWGHAHSASLDFTVAQPHAPGHGPNASMGTPDCSGKGFVFPWLNSLLLSSSPVDRDVGYDALESSILHNEHLLPSFITHCYLVQTGSSIISKRYFLVIGNLICRQAEAHRSTQDQRTSRMLNLPLAVLLHLIIFKLGDLSFSVRSMALRLIPIMEQFFASEAAKLPGGDNPPRSMAPLQVVIGSHLPDTFRAMQLQLSTHFAELAHAHSCDVFNECSRRIMFLHRLRMGGTTGVGSNSVYINHLIEENISGMIAYLAPWMANIQMQPQPLISAGAVGAHLTPSTPASPRGRSLRTFSVLTAKKGPTEIMQQLLNITFLFSSSSTPGGATSAGALTATAPYSVASHLVQDLYTHLIRGRHGDVSPSVCHEDDAEHVNPNLEILITFLFESLSAAQRSNRLTADWLICFQRIALYLSRIAPDHTLKLLIGHILHSSTNSMGLAESSMPTAAASKATLTKSNFALMLLVEVAYELDLSGDESAKVTQAKAQAKPLSAAARRQTNGGGIRVKQPLETVALLLHIGLLGLHYPPTTDAGATEIQQQQQLHVSSFIRRHATSLLINLIQATVFQTSAGVGDSRHQTMAREDSMDTNSEVDTEQTRPMPAFSHSNSRHTLNLAMAPLQLSAPKEKSSISVRHAKGLQLINNLNQYLGWVLCHTATDDQQTEVADVDEVSTDAACLVPGLDLVSLVTILCRIIPAPLNARVFAQSWFVLCGEWSCTCENDVHFKVTSLRLMEIMTADSKTVSAQVFAQHGDLLALVNRAEADLQPWIGEEDDSRSTLPTVQVLAQIIRTIQAVVLSLINRTESMRRGDDVELYQHTIPRLFWLAVHVVTSFVHANNVLPRSRQAIIKPKIESTVMLQCFDFLAHMLEAVARLDQTTVTKSQVVQWIWQFVPNAQASSAAPRVGHHRRSSSFSNFDTLQTSFTGLQNLCHQLLKNNVPATIAKSSVAETTHKSTQLLWKELGSYATARNTALVGRVWGVLSQLAQFTAVVNDDEHCAIASLVDAAFVQHPTTSVLGAGQLHPFMLNLVLQLPSWCLAMSATTKPSTRWDEVAMSVESQTPCLLSAQQIALCHQSATHLSLIAGLFQLPSLASILSRFGSGAFQSTATAPSQHHELLLQQIVPAICESLALQMAPTLMHILFDLFGCSATWIQQQAPVEVAKRPSADLTLTPKSPIRHRSTTSIGDIKSERGKKSKKGRTFSLFSPAKKASNAAMACSIGESVNVSPFHARVHSVTFDLICAFMLHIHWSSVEAACASSVESSQSVRRVLVRFHELSSQNVLAPKVRETFKRVVDAWQGAPTKEMKFAHTKAARLNERIVTGAQAPALVVATPAAAVETKKRSSLRSSPVTRKSVGFSREPTEVVEAPVAPIVSTADAVREITSMPQTFLYTITPPEEAPNAAQITVDTTPCTPPPRQPDVSVYQQTPSKTYSVASMDTPHSSPLGSSITLTYLVETKDELVEAVPLPVAVPQEIAAPEPLPSILTEATPDEVDSSSEMCDDSDYESEPEVYEQEAPIVAAPVAVFEELVIAPVVVTSTPQQPQRNISALTDSPVVELIAISSVPQLDDSVYQQTPSKTYVSSSAVAVSQPSTPATVATAASPVGSPIDIHAVRSLFHTGSSIGSTGTSSPLTSAGASVGSGDWAVQLAAERAERQRSIDLNTAARLERMARLAKCAEIGRQSKEFNLPRTPVSTSTAARKSTADPSPIKLASPIVPASSPNASSIPQLFCPSLSFRNSPHTTLATNGLSMPPLSPNSRLQNQAPPPTASQPSAAATRLQNMKFVFGNTLNAAPSARHHL